MKNDKSPGNDRAKKDFFEFFWDEINNSLSDSINKTFISRELSSSQKQAVTNNRETTVFLLISAVSL